MTALIAAGVIGDTSVGHTKAELAVELEDLRDFIAESVLGASARYELTIASGAGTPPDGATAGGAIYKLDTEGGASTDVLDTIAQTNTHDGQLIILMAENTARVVTLNHGAGGTGEMTLTDGLDFALDTASKWIMLRRDGSAWVDLPGGGDERYDGESTPQWPDPPPGQDGACLAAENIVASYITMLTQTKAALDLAATISGIVDIVAGYIGTQTLFPPALFILNISLAVGALVTLGSEAIEELIDSPNVDVLKCIIMCNASADGAFTADEFDQIKDDIDDQIDDPEKLIMTEWINSYGPVGLTRIAAANDIEEGSCPCDCGWSYLWDFTVASGSGADPDYSWAAFFGYSNYVSSQGWTSIASDNYLTLPNAGSWTYCTFSINVTGSIGGTNHSDILNADYSVLLLTVGLTSGVQTTSLPAPLDPPRTDGVGIETYNAASGQTIITGCRIDGVGTPPPFYGGSFV